MKRMAIVAAAVAAAVSFGMATPAMAKSHRPTVEAAWCSLKIGQPVGAAVTKLGKPHGTDAKSLIRALAGEAPGLKAEEWDQRKGRLGPHPVLLLTYQSGRITKLQAYGDWPSYPIPATGLSCKAFRT